MLTWLAKLVGTQKVIPKVGEFKETLAQVLFWGSIVNYLMVAGTFYYTTLREVAPWFDLPKFAIVIVFGFIAIYVVEYKYVVPSIWAFRGKQMDMRNGNGAADVVSTDGYHANGKVTVAVSGGFDPLNGRGHLTHIQEARKLGDRLVVILSRDDQLVAKGNKPNGTFYPSIMDRIAILKEMRSVDLVVVNIDNDSTCTKSLRLIRPQIFAKGGDRDGPSAMPESELAACEEMGCQIVYGVGDPKTTSSSALVRAANRR